MKSDNRNTHTEYEIGAIPAYEQLQQQEDFVKAQKAQKKKRLLRLFILFMATAVLAANIYTFWLYSQVA